jgi:hypothetical protein
VVVDRDALGEVLALQDPGVQQPVDQQVVDLRDPPAHLKPEVVDGDAVDVVGGVELDLVGGVALAGGTGADPADLLLDPAPCRRIDIRTVEKGGKRVEVRLLVVGWLDLR